MTKEEAKKWFEVQRAKTDKRIENCRNKMNYVDDEIKNLDRKLEAYTIAVEAIEKQIPKKPMSVNFHIDGNPESIDGYACPVCVNGNNATPVSMYEGGFKMAYCYVCGQHIDWSEDNDE